MEQQIAMLVEMGFPENRARKALQLKKDVQPAMDWFEF